MTKRDVCVWFCRVVALVGMLSAVFNSIGLLWNLSLFRAFSLLWPIIRFGLYLFVWFLADPIGTELAAEGKHGTPLTSIAQLGSLTLRCAGLWLFLSASLSFGPTFLIWAYGYFAGSRTSTFSSIPVRMMNSNLATSCVESLLGFLFAFTPRIRTFFGK